MNINNLSISKRLGIGFGIMVVITLLLGLLAVGGIYSLANVLENLGNNRIPGLQAMAELNYQRMILRAETLDVVVNEEKTNIQEALRRIQEARRKAFQQVDQSWEKLLAIPRQSERGRALQEQAKNEYKDWRAVHVEADALITQIAATAELAQRTALFADYRRLLERLIPISERIGQTLLEMTDQQNTGTDQRIASSQSLAIQLEV